MSAENSKPLIQTLKNETTDERTEKRYIHESRVKSKRDQNAQRMETREGADKKIGFEGKGWDSSQCSQSWLSSPGGRLRH